MMLLAVLALLATLDQVSAAVGGTVDNSSLYPADGTLMLDFFEAGFPEDGFAPHCSGVLIHEKVVLTAAHCIDYMEFFGYVVDECPADRPLDNPVRVGPNRTGPGVWMSFYYDPADYDPSNVTNKCQSCLDVARIIKHPLHTPNNLKKEDVALIILTSSYTSATPIELPKKGFLDDLKDSGELQGANFTHVGYGADSPQPPDLEFVDKRQFANMLFTSLNADYITTKKSGEGQQSTCQIDSGGSTLYENSTSGESILVGLTSKGSGNCRNLDKSVRLDTDEALGFIEGILQNLTNGVNFACP